MGLLKGKRAVVTGGANGIGRAVVCEFLEQGAEVIVIDKDVEGLQKLRSDLRHRDFSNKFRGHASRIDDWYALKNILLDAHYDILVNNAGIDLQYSVECIDSKAWDEIFQTNVHGTRMVTSRVLSKMEFGGSIIFITSIHTAQAFPAGAAYDASKHALVGFMRTIALEYGSRGIRANAVAPGSIDNAGPTARLSDKEKRAFALRIPSGRLGTPEDVASLVAFLASDKASYINGAEIRIDGGLSIKSALF